MIKKIVTYFFIVLSFYLINSPAIKADIKNQHTLFDKSVLTVGIFPRRNAIVTTRMFTPLTTYLSDKLGRPVKLVTPKDFPDFWNKVKKNKYDIVHYNQYHYVKSHKEFAYQVIIKNIEQGKSTIAGALFVRADSGINSISDLKGKKVVFGGGEKAMQSHIVARHLILNAGLKNTDYQWSYASNPPNAIISNFFRQNAAAGAGDKVLSLKLVKKEINVSEMKLLAQGPQLAHLPWALNKSISKKLRAKIQELFLELDKTGAGKRLLLKMRVNGFETAIDSDYDAHRKIIKKVLNEKY